MSRGRKNIPTALKKIRGTDQPVRIIKNEVASEPLIKLPSAPRWFTKTAKRIYRTKGAQLKNLSLLTVLDIELFVSFCREYANYIDTSAELDNYGINNTLEFLTKIDWANIPIEKKLDVQEALIQGEDLIIKRLMKTNRESWERAKALGSEFGFTPSARTKITLLSKEDTSNSDFD